MADKIPTYEKQILPPKKGPAVETPFAMDDAAKAQAYGAKTLEQSAESLYWLHKDLKQMAIKERKDKQAAEFAYTTANAKKRLAEEMLRIRTEKHYDEWAEEWEKAKAKVISEVVSGIKDPEVAKEVDKWFASATVELDVDMMAEAANMRKQEGRAQFADALQSAVNNGDMDAVKATLNAMQHTTYYPPEEFERIKLNAFKETEVNRLIAQMQADPLHFDISKVKTQYLDKEDLLVLENKRLAMVGRLEQARNDNEAKLVQQIMEKFFVDGEVLTQQQIANLYHTNFGDTSLPLIRESTYQKLASFFKAAKTAQAGPQAYSIDDMNKELVRLYDMVHDVNDKDFTRMEIEINTAKAKHLIPNEYAKFLLSIVKARRDAIYDAKVPIIDQAHEEFGDMLKGLIENGSIDESTASNMAREFYDRISINAIDPNAQLNNAVVVDIAHDILQENTKSGKITLVGDIGKWNPFVENVKGTIGTIADFYDEFSISGIEDADAHVKSIFAGVKHEDIGEAKKYSKDIQSIIGGEKQ